MTKTNDSKEYAIHPEELTSLLATVAGAMSATILSLTLWTWQFDAPSAVELLPAAAVMLGFLLFSRPLSYRLCDWGERLEQRVVA